MVGRGWWRTVQGRTSQRMGGGLLLTVRCGSGWLKISHSSQTRPSDLNKPLICGSPPGSGMPTPPINLLITSGRRTNRGKLNDECSRAGLAALGAFGYV